MIPMRQNNSSCQPLLNSPNPKRQRNSRTPKPGGLPPRFLLILLFSILAAFLSLSRLHAQSGMLEGTNTFNPGTGVDIAVYTIAIQTNGQILIGGDFSSFDDVERIAVARLNTNGSRDDSYNPGAALGGSFPTVNSVALQS